MYGADYLIDMPLQAFSGAKGKVALAAAVVSTLLTLAAYSAMRTDLAPSTLLARAAFSAMLTDTAPSTLLAIVALSAMRARHCRNKLPVLAGDWFQL